jgi:hypothetical protein
MPQSATATGLIDAVMPVEDMPAKLLDYQSHLLKVASKKDGDVTHFDAGEHLAKIISLLRGRVGHDFSKYKENPIEARRRAEKSLKHAAHTLDRQPKWRFSVACSLPPSAMRSSRPKSPLAVVLSRKCRPFLGGILLQKMWLHVTCKVSALSLLGPHHRALHLGQRFSSRTCDKPRLVLPRGLPNYPLLPEGERRRYLQHERLQRRRRDGDLLRRHPPHLC